MADSLDPKSDAEQLFQRAFAREVDALPADPALAMRVQGTLESKVVRARDRSLIESALAVAWFVGLMLTGLAVLIVTATNLDSGLTTLAAPAMDIMADPTLGAGLAVLTLWGLSLLWQET